MLKEALKGVNSLMSAKIENGEEPDTKKFEITNNFGVSLFSIIL